MAALRRVQIAELEEMQARGQPYVGCFFVKDPASFAAAGVSEDDEAHEAAEQTQAAAAPASSPPSPEGEAADHLHEYGTFAQVHNIHKLDGSSGVMLMLMGTH